VGRRVVAEGLAFDACRRSLGVPETNPPDVEAAPVFPTRDVTDVSFVTLDPPGSRDLDQAVALERTSTGYRVRYAITDVGAFITPGDPVDTDSRVRAVTIYAPDKRTPLYPPALGEGVASLLPDQRCPAIVWTIDLDETGQQTSVAVERAVVRSRDKLDYPTMQTAADHDALPEPIALLPEIGRLRLAQARARDAIDLALPEQTAVPAPDGGWTLKFREPLAIERWNAEISLLTGMAAARLMLHANVGLLRTVPEPTPGTVAHLRHIAAHLKVPWPENATVGEVLEAAGPSVAFREAAASLLRGAGYTPFDGAPPALKDHAGVGAPYAHVTAPLRRLADRFVNEIVVAVANGRTPPAWAREALPELPGLMATGERRAKAVERCVLDHLEALVLKSRIGDHLHAVVVDVVRDDVIVIVEEPAIRARVTGATARIGASVSLRIDAVDTTAGVVKFSISGPRSTSSGGGGR
jgi:exoribonuclease R